jgi:Leucine-rich repeat (LRR) protein
MKLELADQNLTELPELPVGLKILNCSGNPLKRLPELPEGLTHLFCDNCELTELPKLPNSLERLICNNYLDLGTECNKYRNKITSLPELPDNLIYLNCSFNQLTQLPRLPNGLIWLFCNNNPITSLPRLSCNLINLHCCNCELTELPELPVGLEELLCVKNYITKLPYLPNSLRTCIINISIETAFYFSYIGIENYNNNYMQVPDFGNISIISNFKEYRKCHNALIKFQRHIRRISNDKKSLKGMGRIFIRQNKIKINSEDLPNE